MTIYASPYPLATPTALTNGISSTPNSIAVDSAGSLYVALSGAGIEQYTSPITFASTPALTLTTNVSSPNQILLDALGNLYVANGGTSTVRQYPPPYSGASTTITNSYSYAMAILP